jgi:hypothetical protein
MQIGVITQTEGEPDAYTPALGGDGYSGNTMLEENGEVGSGGTHNGGTPQGGAPQRQRRHGPRRSEQRAKPEPRSTDGMDALEGSPQQERQREQNRQQPRPRDDAPYGVGTGNPFDRERFRKELAEKPWLKEKFAGISLGENQDRTANLAVQETAMNRAVVRGTSLETQLRRHRHSGKDEGGYYAGYANSYSPEKRQMFEDNLERALGGSNVTDYATDNASSWLAEKNKATGRFTHHRDFNRESFFSPGHAEPVLRDRWRALRQKVRQYENPDPSVDGIAPPSMGKPGPQS